MSIYNIYDDSGRVQRRVALFSGITDQKRAEETIWNQANYDLLTGLPNRRLFLDRLRHEISKVARTELPVALLFIDLDEFKEVNDTLGHDKGDILLKEAARRIVDCARESDTVARLGGDEFTVIFPYPNNMNRIDLMAQEIIDKLRLPFTLGEEKEKMGHGKELNTSQKVYISASIGITLYPNDGDSIEELLKHADQALYASKNAGRNRYSYFTCAMQQVAEMRADVINDLRVAVAGDQFRVYYQPIVSLTTGEICKAEALVRWMHPVRGLVGPVDFITLAEETGMIVEIGDWVFKEAVRQVKYLRETYNPEFQISVNKSPVQFHHHSHIGKWLNWLQELELPGQSISVEITEGLLLDSSSEVTDKLLAFRDNGIEVSLDDFGTGYSSLSYLKKFDIDYLKIDQSFVSGLENDESDVALCEAIILMAHKMGIKVIAEGVETEYQHDFLKQAGCDYAQGYLYSRPVPVEEFERLLIKEAY